MIIEHMASQFPQAGEIEWKVQDVRHMEEIESKGFRFAIDKGTLDSMIPGRWLEVPDEARESMSRYVDEVRSKQNPLLKHWNPSDYLSRSIESWHLGGSSSA